MINRWFCTALASPGADCRCIRPTPAKQRGLFVLIKRLFKTKRRQQQQLAIVRALMVNLKNILLNKQLEGIQILIVELVRQVIIEISKKRHLLS